MKKKYWLSFVEEYILNPKYEKYKGGRVEIYDNYSNNIFADDELRFLTTKIDEFYEFREKWDLQECNVKEFAEFKKQLKKFQNNP